jgi:hypothetical protein
VTKISAIIGLALAAVPCSTALGASAASPQALYRALLTTQYAPLPSDFYSAKVGSDEPSKEAKRHHAVGSVQVTIDSGNAAVYYTVFPTAADVAARFREPLSKTNGVVTFHMLGRVPGYRQPCRWANGTIEGKNAFGKTVRNGFTVMALQRGNLVLGATTFSTDNETSGDIPGTIRLLGSALAHLRRVQTRLSS